MIFLRHCLALLIATAASGLAQDAPAESSGSTSSGGESGSGSGASSTFSTTPAPSESGSLLGPSYDPPTGAASNFGQQSGGLGATGGGEPATGANTSGQGAGFATPKAPSESPSFTLPGFYGSSATTFVAGEGRLARPRFRVNLSVAQGYDDNVLQTPTNGEDIPGVEVIIPGTEEPARLEPIFGTRVRRVPGGGLVTETVVVGFKSIPAKPPKTEIIGAIEAPERRASLVTQSGIQFDMQIFTRRSLFTFDVSANASHYWDRPGPEETDYNGSVAFSFLYRVAPRMQFTAQLNAAYLSQPDISRINTPQNQLGSSYLNANFKMDLSYRWAPRLTSLVSFSDNYLGYTEKAQQTGNYNDTLFGTELRYLWGPRLTLLGELRYSIIAYEQSPTLDASTVFALLGAEFRVSNKFAGSIRVGQATRSFEEGGEKSSTPYLESNFVYRVAPASVLNLSNRFGFEETGRVGDERQVLRTTLSYAQLFSPRLSSIASLTYLHEVNTTAGLDETNTVDTLDLTTRLEYRMTRNFSLSASYTFTNLTNSTGFGEYYRNRLFLGGEYVFGAR